MMSKLMTAALVAALVVPAAFLLADGGACPMAGKTDKAACTAEKSGCGSAEAGCTMKKDAESVSVPGGGEAKAAASGYKVGDKAADFTAKHAQSGQDKSLADLKGEKATVVVFWNQNCPYVEGSDASAADRVAAMSKTYKDQGVSVIAVDAGANNSPEAITDYAKDKPFPVLINSDSKVAAAFGANYTPHTFVLDSNLNVVYKGGFDSGATKDASGNVEPWAENAVKDVLAGKPVAVTEKKGTGCSIKWADGAKPAAKATSTGG